MSTCIRIEAKGETRWVARVSLGTHVQRRVNERTRKECEEAVARLKLGHVPASTMTLESYFRQHFLPNSPCRESTRLAYEGVFRSAIGPALGAIRLDRIRPADVQAWVTAHAADHKPNTVRQALRVLRSILNGAVALELLDRNPAANIVTASPAKTPPERWTQEEARQFLLVTERTLLYDLWCLLLEGGLRIGEALALRPEDITTRDRIGVVAVTKSITATAAGPAVGQTKTGFHREVEISDELAQRLRALPGPWCFAGSDPSSPRSYKSVSGYFQRACRAAGVPEITLHALRHTSASIQIEVGVPLQVVQHRLGHASMSSTTHYARVNDAMSAAAARSLAATLKGSQCSTS